MNRCEWVPVDRETYLAYHDEEWGLPVHDDVHLFEMLVLEGAQAGLSWSTIQASARGTGRRSRGSIPKVALFDKRKVERLLQNPAIVRNRAKVESTVANAKAVRRVQDEEGSLDALLWSSTDIPR